MFAVDYITAHRYDPAADALYLTFASTGSPKIVRSAEVTPEIVADVDDLRRMWAWKCCTLLSMRRLLSNGFALNI